MLLAALTPYVGTSAAAGYDGLPEVLGSGMEFCSLVRSFWVSFSSRSRMSTYCLYLFMSQGMPAHGSRHSITHSPIAKAPSRHSALQDIMQIWHMEDDPHQKLTWHVPG